MPRRKRYRWKDPAAASERNRQHGIASQRPDVLIRRLARMDLTDEQRQRLADVAAGVALDGEVSDGAA